MPNAYDGFRSSRDMRAAKRKERQREIMRDLPHGVAKELKGIGRTAFKEAKGIFGL